jgi:hypothetical protein
MLVRHNMTLGFPDHLTSGAERRLPRAYLQQQRVVPHVVADDGPVLGTS